MGQQSAATINNQHAVQTAPNPALTANESISLFDTLTCPESNSSTPTQESRPAISDDFWQDYE